ncbi:protein root UVB sensitive 5 isoform X2 [Silene latifolia]|uniref:protein root UVB sensitive 5 isoform X2 n=1 Tax=Silene latifolia TaxID=37657 RepID=UPI003D78A600
MFGILQCSVSPFNCSINNSFFLQRTPNFHCCCLSSKFPENQDNSLDGEKGSSPLILVERYSNGTAKRYVWGEEFSKQTLIDQQSVDDKLRTPDYATNLQWLPDDIKDFILPAGFPGSVSDDYLEYMLWQFPTNVTGWMCHALVTSSLLKAFGVGSFSGSAAAASAAAIRWVSKDGIGAVGRLIIGGRFGSLFDDDPKQWRMYADFIGSAGSIFDLTTPIYPTLFLPLASLGNLSKAVARGLKDPSNRVIQNHFAVFGNLGEIAAKEEVWEVTAQLFGLGLGILILDAPGIVTSYPALVTTWLGLRLLHLWLRYQSLSVLKFNTINLKRARILAKAHVLHSQVPGCIDCNKDEQILSWQRFLQPRILFGVPLDQLVGGETSATMVKKFFNLYTKEKYILVAQQWERRDFEVWVSFKAGATSLSALQSVWQAYWLYENWDSSLDLTKALEDSLSCMEGRFDNFMELLEDAGWNIHKININVSKEPYIEQFDPS